MTLAADGTIEDNIEFFAATIESKAKLAYDDVSELAGRPRQLAAGQRGDRAANYAAEGRVPAS